MVLEKVLVLGLGKSGAAAARLLAGRAEVHVWDAKQRDRFDPGLIGELEEKGTILHFGEKPSAEGWDRLILSPGVPTKLDLVEQARRNGAVISGELQLAYDNCPGTFIGITGTNGKTTTTSLVGEIVKLSGRKTEVVGNIGLPVAETVMSSDADTVMVTEISSFQLETISDFRPKVSAILNITPDHLDRHGTFEEYVRVKHLVHKNQGPDDYYVYNADDQGLLEYSKNMTEGPEKVPFSRKMTAEELRRLTGCRICAVCEDGALTIDCDGEKTVLCGRSDLKIPGSHNLENALAAAAVCCCAGIEKDAIVRGLKSFAGVEHRIEFVREFEGVRYVNDSKGTNPDASMKAIEATATPILLIAGGYEKNSDFTEFIEGFGGKVRYLLLLGQTARRFADTARKCGFPEDRMIFCEDMDQCVSEGRRLAQPGDTVLLSPASASWGMYDNYEKRGEHFKALVNALR
ncbi:MAG: UDP-N-acetylmuramoyl-L-alanine--D-glutamate ligase [Firmicutes bacterium]|nr:UDP-N-acetylmuramoyl-L-alanine--D-glutamate ligase [Bacillota bacterium]